MTISTRIALGISAAALSLSLALAPAAFAQDKMGKDDGMKKDSMSKDGMKKDDAMAKDGMKKDSMAKDGMKKDDGDEEVDCRLLQRRAGSPPREAGLSRRGVSATPAAYFFLPLPLRAA